VKVLKVLEKKIYSLVELVKELKTENAKLAEENAQLLAKLESVQDSMFTESNRVEKLDQEKTMTKMVVDDLIKSIDSLVEYEKSQ